MILDTLENAGRYCGLHAAFRQAFDFLMRRDLKDLPAGRHAIDGDRVFALVSKGPGRKKQDGRLEVHEKHIDIQYVLVGTDEMGWKPRSACTSPSGPYDPDKDIRFFSDEPDSWVAVRPGGFAVFLPEDAHLPLVSAGEVHKVVIKVAV